MSLSEEINKRRTFAIISHPDAGKTTITEKLLLFGKLIQSAGTVKGRGSDKHATSDWMAMEKERGISVTTSVMQFPYLDKIVNLLDTPGHEDFSEDTYRTLTAVDSALMVIDGAKGVEPRTIKLMEVCRLRTTPILTFINKCDRDIQDPISLLDEIESVLNIKCAPVNWPIGMGKDFYGVYDIVNDKSIIYQKGHGHEIQDEYFIEGLNNPELDEVAGEYAVELRETLELVMGASHKFELSEYLAGNLTPVYFGTALGNFGVREMLAGLVNYSPSPKSRESNQGNIDPHDTELSGFVFKIQANMDPKHRDRIAFMRLVSGKYAKGMKLHHVRLNKSINVSNAVTFLAGDRSQTDEAYGGDILGLHNHGTIQIGDTFTQGKAIKFSGIPNFSPEMFRLVILKDPLKAKQLQKGLQQLSEEGATQLFMPLANNYLILGAVGILQFDLVAYRLKNEYKVEATYENVSVYTTRWVECSDDKILMDFRKKEENRIALDGGGHLTFLAPSRAVLDLTIERWPEVKFLSTREH